VIELSEHEARLVVDLCHLDTSFCDLLERRLPGLDLAPRRLSVLQLTSRLKGKLGALKPPDKPTDANGGASDPP